MSVTGDQTFPAVVASDGTAVITVQPPNSRLQWTVSQVSAELPSAPAGATCTVRKNGSFVTLLIPNGDVAGGDPPVLLRGPDKLTITWTGCTPGSEARAFVIYTEDRI